MTMTAAMQRCAAWIACFAILLAVLAPSISHALAAHAQHDAWVEICSVEGSKMIQVDADQHPQKPAHDQIGHFEHCPFCLNHSLAQGLPPAADFVMPVIAGSHLLPPLYYQASRPLFAWAVAQPRAPPSLS